MADCHISTSGPQPVVLPYSCQLMPMNDAATKKPVLGYVSVLVSP